MAFLWTILGLFLLWLWLRGHWFAAVLTPAAAIFLTVLAGDDLGLQHAYERILIFVGVEAMMLIPALVRHGVFPAIRAARHAEERTAERERLYQQRAREEKDAEMAVAEEGRAVARAAAYDAADSAIHAAPPPELDTVRLEGGEVLEEIAAHVSVLSQAAHNAAYGAAMREAETYANPTSDVAKRSIADAAMEAAKQAAAHAAAYTRMKIHDDRTAPTRHANEP